MEQGLKLTDRDSDYVDLRSYAALMRRQMRFIATVTAACLALAVVYTVSQSKLYLATTDVDVGPVSELGEIEEVLFNTTDVTTLAERVASVPVVSRAFQEVGVSATDEDVDEFIEERLTVEILTATTILRISATDEQPRQAAALVEAIAETFLETLREASEERLTKVEAELDARAEAAGLRIASLQRQLATTPAADRTSLERERDELLITQRFIAARKVELRSAFAARRTGEVIRPALVPIAADSPRPLQNVALGIAAGLAVGVGAGLVRDRLDERIRDPHEARAVSGLPVLAVLPLPKQGQRARSDSAELEQSRSCDRLRAIILARTTEPAPTGVVLLPVNERVDPTPVAALLSEDLASHGCAVSMVWASARPQDSFAAAASVAQDVLPSPGQPAGSHALAGSLSARTEPSSHADIRLVILSPASSSGAGELDSHPHNVLLVCRLSNTTEAELEEAVALVAQVRAECLGLVLVDGHRGGRRRA